MLIGIFVKQSHSLGKNSQCQAASASYKEGMLNWWQTLKPETCVSKKDRICMPYRSLRGKVRHAPLEIIVPRQEDISGAATALIKLQN